MSGRRIMEARMRQREHEDGRRGEAWERLARQLQRPALGLTRHAEDASDLVQQTLLRLMSRAPEQVGNIGYARRTMMRLWLDEQRAMRRRLRRMVARGLTRSAWHMDRDDVEQAERLERVHEGIEALPPRQRAALVLRLVEDLDYPQIAEAMECEVGNVRSLLHAARTRLRRHAGEM